MVSRSRVPPPVHRVKHSSEALSRNPGEVAGVCGGSNALNLAYLFGCNPIYLLGFDMGGERWHDNHRDKSFVNYARHFIPALELMALELKADGVSVFNCNPDSALRCFPFANIDEVIR